ncbi:GGDEF domain-containing protein [Comamonas flocculans]|nr:diguanylate cyclase [Comamonas flocculans]
MSKLLLRIGLWGVQERSPRRVRQILLVNLAALGAAVVTVSYQLFYLAYGLAPFAQVVVLNGCCLAAYLLCLWLNRRGRYQLARDGLVATTSVHLYLVDLLAGIEVHLFYFTLLFMLPLLYHRQGARRLAVLGAVVLLLFVLAHFGRTPAMLPEPILRVMYVANAAGAMGMIGVIAYLFNAEIIRMENTLARNNRSLRRQSLTDELTGLMNRRSLMQFLKREWSRMQREQGSLSILMCDIDDFKSYNDHYGHPAGDQVLRRIALPLATAAQRPTDMVARYGGEEFTIVLSNTPASEALHLARRLLAEVRALQIAHAHSRAAAVVTMSVGMASTTVQAPGGFQELLQQADQALYEAKKAGRNRVAVHRRGAAEEHLSVV